MGRAKHGSRNRDGTRFLALPHVVMDSPGFLSLSHPAVRLLLDMCRQLDGKNNGRLVASMNYLSTRGWSSNDTVVRARRELQTAGLLFETRKGARPNRAGWYAVTWLPLDHTSGMDCSQSAHPRGLYLQKTQPVLEPINASLTPPDGVEAPTIAPSGGVRIVPTTPPDGAIHPHLTPPPTPSGGAYLELPSTGTFLGGVAVQSLCAPTRKIKSTAKDAPQ